MPQTGYTPIIHYRSTTSGNVPLAADLNPGELGINIADNDMSVYMENASGVVKRFFNNPAALKYPTADGTAANQVLKTDGSGTLAFYALTASRALVSDGSGGLGVSATTSTELGYVSGVTSAIQTQINTKAPSASPTFTGTVVLPSTTSIGNVDATEISYLDGVTSAIQTQINSKITAVSSTDNAIVRFDGTSGAVQNSGCFIDDSGNMSVGMLSVSAAQNTNGQLLIYNTTARVGGNQYGVRFADSSYETNASIYVEQVSSGNNAAALVFATSNGSGGIGLTSGTERMRLDASGNLGLGVTPSAWDSVFKNLQIGGSGYSGSFYSQINGGSQLGLVLNAYYSAGWKYAASSSTPASFYQQYNGQHYWYTAPSGTAGDPIPFGDAKMMLDVSGNLGVGTTSPAYTLDTHTNNNAEALRLMRKNVVSTEVGPNLDFWIAQTNAQSARLATVGAQFKSAWGGELVFFTKPANGSPDTAVSERMRLDSSGNLLVGYTSSNGSYKLQVNSQIFATSSTIATSDAKYKTDVVPLKGNALSLVDALNPVQFTWKQHPVHDFNTDIPTIGFLAQEVQDVLKDTAYVNSVVKESECELPDGTKEKFLGIAEGNLVALLTAAIQELKARIEKLENK